MISENNHFYVDFTCPWCGRKAKVIEEEVCEVRHNEVKEFYVESWEKDEGTADEAEAHLAKTTIHPPDTQQTWWVCSECIRQRNGESLVVKAKE